MRLLVTRYDGTLEEVVDNLDEYDLASTLAKLELVDNIKTAIRRVQLYNSGDGIAKAIRTRRREEEENVD